MTNIVVMGECMIEFSPLSTDTYNQSFAGDVYNTAVYLKRLLTHNVSVSMLSAVGEDVFSERMLSAFEQENIDISWIQKIPNKHLGAYLIEVSPEGERSFVYWRNDSAAKLTISALDEQIIKQLTEYTDIFYFSGISLAILNNQDRALFWQLIARLRTADVKIVFDSNYRARLWESQQEAIEQFELAFNASHIVFAGVEDFDLLYAYDDFNLIEEFLAPFAIVELIIKNGPDGLMCISASKHDFLTIEAIESVVDSTAAGDSFNAGYLAARALGASIVESAKYACKVSGFVIQHRGAIVNIRSFTQFIEQSL